MGNYPGYIPGPNQPNPMNQYNPSIPNLNYSIPNQMPFQGNYSSGNINPYAGQGMPPLNQIGAGFNAFDPNQNYLNQSRNNSMIMNQRDYLDQNNPNNANFNQAQLKNEEMILQHMQEREKLKELTKKIRERIEGRFDLEKELENKDEEEEEKEKEEEGKNKKVDFREERQKRRELLFNQGLGNMPFETTITKSEYFYSRDRAFLSELITAPLKTNGIFGTKILTDYDKQALLDDKESFRPQNVIQLTDEDEYFERAIKDGIYLDYVKQQLFSYNIQKSEQRAFRESKKEWFRPNGDIRMDNDIFSDVVTKPIDITLSSNDQFGTFVPNSLFSGRNTGKMRIFKLKVIIGKIIFRCHPCFSDEDKLVSELIQLHKDFYSTMNMLNIPYLKEKIRNICIKLDSYSSIHIKTDAQETEVKNMNIFLNEATNYLAKEKELINSKANALYNKWLELKTLRRQQGHQNTNIKLNVIRFNSNDMNPNIYDYAFILTNNENIDTGEALSKEEKNRRAKVSNNLVFIKVYINGVYAFETKPAQIRWPSYEVEINTQFLLFLYTRPTKFEVELYINKKIVKKFKAEPPGMFSKTVTSSASLMEEINFGSADDFYEEEIINEKEDKSNINKSKIKDYSEDEKLLKKENIPQKVESPASKTEHDQIEGSILLKTEWDGKAPDLPPTKIEDKLELVNKQIEFKKLIRKYNDLDYPFDVNDPRNVAFVEEVKKKKLGMQLKFVYKEYLLTNFDAQSKRQYLLKQRLKKRSLNEYKFPILEAQIEKSEKIKKVLEDLKKQEAYQEDKDEERERKIKMGIDALKHKYGNVLSDDEYLKLQKEKISILKKDKITKEAYGYTQIISEAEIYSNPIMFFKEFFRRVFTRARKLAPIRIKPAPVKIESTKKMKVNIHIVKGYNIPLRIYAYPQKIIDNQKLKSIETNANITILRDVFLANNPRLNALRNSRNIQEMAGINNSNVFNNVQGSNNNSFSFDMRGQNPNFMNYMGNPNANPFGFGNMGNNNFNVNIDQVGQDIQRLNQMQDERINSFIEVKISYYDQEKVFRTDSIRSIHPDYNKQFEFYIFPKNNNEHFSKEELSQCPGSFYFTLYDEIITAETRTVNATIIYTETKKRKYLGSFQIPFSTVFQNDSCLDTICKINVPNTVFGYYSDTTSVFSIEETDEDLEEKEAEIEKGQKMDQENQGQRLNMIQDIRQANYKDLNISHIINPFVNSYLSLYITLDPVPNFTTSDETSFVSGSESMLLLNKGTEWLKTLKEKKIFKNRYIKLFAEDFNNCSVFVSRYLRAEGQRPPDLFCDVNDEFAIEKVSRYVSLIPFIDDSTSMDAAEDMPDCWCTDNEFLTLGFGDYEEHAILLCNYFTFIDNLQNSGCKSYLCLGDAHPEGSTVYVVRMNKDFKEVELWNAKTGDCFYFDKHLEYSKMFCLSISSHYKRTRSSFDQICPMKSVGSIITPDNVYANAQKETDPALIDFDITNKSNWKPFLDTETSEEFFKGGVKSVQADIIYSEQCSDKVDLLKKEIRTYLQEQIKEIRINDNPLPTQGLGRENAKIEKVLAKYEMFSFSTPKSEINLNKRIKDSRKYDNDFDEEKKRRKNQLREEQMLNLQNNEKEIKEEFNSTADIYGFPLNLSYTTKKEIWEQIKLTNVHLIAGINSQLSLSIYIDPLPNEIFSIWIFLAVLNDA